MYKNQEAFYMNLVRLLKDFGMVLYHRLYWEEDKLMLLIHATDTERFELIMFMFHHTYTKTPDAVPHRYIYKMDIPDGYRETN